MRYVKFFEELNIQTYLNDKNVPAFNPKSKEIAKLDKEEFFKKYPKIETTLLFKDKEATYELYFKDIKSDCRIEDNSLSLVNEMLAAMPI